MQKRKGRPKSPRLISFEDVISFPASHLQIQHKKEDELNRQSQTATKENSRKALFTFSFWCLSPAFLLALI